MSDRAAAQTDAVPRTAREPVKDAPDTEPEVLIIGAGPVGLFAAILLSEKGIRVEIVVDRVEKVERSEGARVAVAESFIVRPELVLGADGHRSIVRKALRDSWTGMSPPELFAVFEVSVDGDPGNEVRVVLENGQSGVFWPLGRHRARWSFQIAEWEGFEESRPIARLREVGQTGDRQAEGDPRQRLVREAELHVLVEQSMEIAPDGCGRRGLWGG